MERILRGTNHVSVGQKNKLFRIAIAKEIRSSHHKAGPDPRAVHGFNTRDGLATLQAPPIPVKRYISIGPKDLFKPVLRLSHVGRFGGQARRLYLNAATFTPEQPGPKRSQQRISRLLVLRQLPHFRQLTEQACHFKRIHVAIGEEIKYMIVRSVPITQGYRVFGGSSLIPGFECSDGLERAINSMRNLLRGRKFVGRDVVTLSARK